MLKEAHWSSAPTSRKALDLSRFLQKAFYGEVEAHAYKENTSKAKLVLAIYLKQ